MGREVRRVPAGWEHPKRSDGTFIPLLKSGVFAKADADWNEEREKWSQGFVRSYGKDGTCWEPRPPEATWFRDWYGSRPDPFDYMPDWPESERTHWQMYEDTSEGTPISPVMETPESLARWLAETGASSFGSQTATYEQWLHTIRAGSAPSAMFFEGGPIKSGVEGMYDAAKGDA